MLHRSERPAPGKRCPHRHIEGDLLVGRPLGVDILGRIGCQGFKDFGAGRAGIGSGDLDARFPGAPRNRFVAGERASARNSARRQSERFPQRAQCFPPCDRVCRLQPIIRKWGKQCICVKSKRVPAGTGSAIHATAAMAGGVLPALHRALRSVLLVLGLDGVARRLPLRVGPVPQLVEIGAGRVALAAVKGDGLSRQPVAAVGDKERRKILQLLDACRPVPSDWYAQCVRSALLPD